MAQETDDDGDVNDATPFTELGDHVREAMTGSLTDDDPLRYAAPGLTLKDLNMTATYRLSGFGHAVDHVLSEMDEPPEWDDETHRREWLNRLATSIVTTRMEDDFDVKTSGFSVNTGVEWNNNDVYVTVMY